MTTTTPDGTDAAQDSNDELPITRSVYGSLAECEAEHARRRAAQDSSATNLITLIVDRDTPPDNRNEVVDCDVRGNPITRGDIDRTTPAAPIAQPHAIGQQADSGYAAVKQVADRTDQPGFEAWAKGHVGLPLDLAGDAMRTSDGLYSPTYKFGRTEIAWHAWANRSAHLSATNSGREVSACPAFNPLVKNGVICMHCRQLEEAHQGHAPAPQAAPLTVEEVARAFADAGLTVQWVGNPAKPFTVGSVDLQDIAKVFDYLRGAA